MSKISKSKFLKRASAVTAMTVLMAVGSAAFALNGMLAEQPTSRTKPTSTAEFQLAHVVCQGNWVNAGCTAQPSTGGNGSENPPPKIDSDPCPTFSPSRPIIFQGGTGTDCGQD